MKMLDDIIDGAVDDKISLASLLRKCLVIADKLKNAKLKAWVLGELNGYEEDGLPEYRTLSVNAVGLVLGPFGKVIKDQPIPAAMLEKEHQHWATTAHMAQPISAYEGLAKSDSDSLVIQWPADLVGYYERVFEGHALNRAHQVIPRASIGGMVDKVRNKLLEFALELRNDIGSSEPTPQNPPPAVVEHHVTNIIFGGQTNVSGGSISGDVIQGVNQNVIKGDFATLSGALKQIGFTDASLADLKTALDDDAKEEQKAGIGPKVAGWIKSAVAGLANGTLKVSSEVATKVATTAILTFLGGGVAL